MKYYEPVDLTNPRLRKLAKELGPVWMRVSGTWATKTYYDLDGHTGGGIPEGYQNLLTKELWDAVLDFAKDLNLKILISVSNCPGLHAKTGKWEPEQTKLLLDYSKAYGVPVSAVEFMNEPNMMCTSGAPEGWKRRCCIYDYQQFP